MIMVAFSSLLLTLSAAAGALAAPTELAKRDPGALAKRQTYTGSETGTANGYYFMYWNGGGGSGTFTLDSTPGEYTMTWSGEGNLVGGTGWQTGAARAIAYSGTYSPDGNSYLSVYGWTTSPLVEYYITESFGTYNPSSAATAKGSVTSDGGTYTILETTRTNEPSILGTSTFQQYWSVRTSNRVGGTVTTANHFNAWAALGMTLGTYNYQILATEGYESSGTSTITVSEGTGSTGSSSSSSSSSKPTTTSTTSVAPPTTSTTSTMPTTTTSSGSGGGTVAEWGQCGGMYYSGSTSCVSGTTCVYSNAWYSQCLA